MNPLTRCQKLVGCLVLVLPLLAVSARAQTPSADKALKLVPIQRDVDISRPSAEEIAKCTISPRKMNGRMGWVVEDPNGAILRVFVNTNGDNAVDRWSYYKHGLEVYCDIDSNFNGKADQYRWFHTGGSRWGLDRDEDGTIDAWKAISAEEVSAEVVAALAKRDVGRFRNVVLALTELKMLGVGPEKMEQIAKKINGIDAKFQELASQQQSVTQETKWVQFSGNRPGIVPAGRDGASKDLRVYENVVAIVQTGEEHGQVQIGTLVQLGDVWRVINLPQVISATQTQLASEGFFFQPRLTNRNQPPTSESNAESEKLLARLQELDGLTSQAKTPEEQAKFNAQRADLLEQMADRASSPEDRVMWIRQMADMISMAVQSGAYPDGVNRLGALAQKLAKNAKDKDLVPYVIFRQLSADYGRKVQVSPAAKFAEVQAEWLKNLEKYAATYPRSPDTAEALLQLAIAQEFAGQEKEAKKWYVQIVRSFPNSPVAPKAAGALSRLDSVGKTISLRGQSPTGNLVDLAKYRGKVVLVQYWATWCEPCKADMVILKDLLARYGRSGFEIIGVNLDSSSEQMTAYLSENRLPWSQICEEGGLDSRPANELGILTLPTMLLIDQQGRVINRNIHVAEIDRELRKLIR